MAVDFAINMQFFTDEGHTAETIAETINNFFGDSPFCGATIYESRTLAYTIEYSIIIHAPQSQGVIKELISEIEHSCDTGSFYGHVDVYELDVLRSCVNEKKCDWWGYTKYELGEKSLNPRTYQ